MNHPRYRWQRRILLWWYADEIARRRQLRRWKWCYSRFFTHAAIRHARAIIRNGKLSDILREPPNG